MTTRARKDADVLIFGEGYPETGKQTTLSQLAFEYSGQVEQAVNDYAGRKYVLFIKPEAEPVRVVSAQFSCLPLKALKEVERVYGVRPDAKIAWSREYKSGIDFTSLRTFECQTVAEAKETKRYATIGLKYKSDGKSGVYVTGVTQGAPSDRAGVQPGCSVVGTGQFYGRDNGVHGPYGIRNASDLKNVLALVRPGQVLPLKVKKGDAYDFLPVVPAENDQTSQEDWFTANRSALPHMTIAEMSKALKIAPEEVRRKLTELKLTAQDFRPNTTKAVNEAEDFSEYEDLLKLDAEQEKTLFNRPIQLTPEEAFSEAKKLGKGNVPKETEQIIAKSARTSYRYAKEVLKSRFPLGEKSIAGSARGSVAYAHLVLKPGDFVPGSKRFPLGEPTIAKSASDSYYYASDVIKAPFALGERAISDSADYSCAYAVDVLKARFPLGEPVIRNSEFWPEYKAHFNIP